VLQRRAAAGEAAAARARDRLQARDLPGAREAMIAAGNRTKVTSTKVHTHTLALGRLVQSTHI
jgi:hypothetical protein